ncbi:molybdate transport system substrate-binding protein [Alkalihalobacillus xiaoxiensis]|uniref:Molybdate transport system substrate-binding protein n=1 Tax=Shouchella xiaoxiensis TaxID=766895 RepID=A0ABS2SXB3_9BACI|nr:molybdate ABC transporter substrate-binding protein [Shouchella xiaoxiensis]MBM7839666.1 molybdate transport system substrate-binding protein [Shouchella xiaoxiensis]
MKKRILSFVAITTLAGCQASSTEETSELLIMAAASLSDALEELKESYEEETGVELTINYGASGQLRQQIQQGAPADLFLSASTTDMEQVEEELIESTPLLENQLVLITVPELADEVQGLDQLVAVDYRHLAIGQPETVPAGRYAKQVLENEDLWDEVEERIIYGKDVRQVLTYVETGNADVGLVYATDARNSADQVVEITTAPAGSHDPIIYPLGLLEASEEAEHFYQWLQQEEALTVFEQYGFQRGQ